jgi:phosphoribosyl-ATP pyrophosphohydrolase
MQGKTYVPEGETPVASQIGATLETLAQTIANRRGAGEESYTYRLLTGCEDEPLKKVTEEAGEVALAGKDVEAAQKSLDAHRAAAGVPPEYVERCAKRLDDETDHLRYEAADVVYHLLVVLERYHIGIDELAAELNARMTPEERPQGGALIVADHVRRRR